VSNKAKNEPVALYAGVWQFVAMVADARKHGQGMLGVWRVVEWMYELPTALHHPKGVCPSCSVEGETITTICLYLR